MGVCNREETAPRRALGDVDCDGWCSGCGKGASVKVKHFYLPKMYVFVLPDVAHSLKFILSVTAAQA